MFNEIEKLMRPLIDIVPEGLPGLSGGGRITKSGIPVFGVQCGTKDGIRSYRFPVPGVSKENVSVKVENGSRLVLGYKLESETEEGKSISTSIYSLSLPDSIDPTTVKAKVEDGVAVVTFAENKGNRDIEVEVQ